MIIARGLELLSRTCHPAAGLAVCVAVNYLVAYAIFSSSYGSTFILSDDERSSIVWIPLLVGAGVGLLQALSLGARVAAVGSLVSLLFGVAAFVMFVTLVLCAVGGLVGIVAARALTRSAPPVWQPRVVLLAASAVASVMCLISALSPEHDEPDLVRALMGEPTALVRIDGDAYPPSVTGRLADVDGCLGIVGARRVLGPVGKTPSSEADDPATGRAVVIWPPGTSVTSEPFSVTTQGHTYRLGDDIAVGGGWVVLGEEDPLPDQAPVACRRNAFIL